jgi:hypothetical protein
LTRIFIFFCTPGKEQNLPTLLRQLPSGLDHFRFKIPARERQSLSHFSHSEKSLP